MTRSLRNRISAIASGAPIIAVPTSIGGLMLSMGSQNGDIPAMVFGSIGLAISAILAASLTAHVVASPSFA